MQQYRFKLTTKHIQTLLYNHTPFSKLNEEIEAFFFLNKHLRYLLAQSTTTSGSQITKCVPQHSGQVQITNHVTIVVRKQTNKRLETNKQLKTKQCYASFHKLPGTCE